MMVQMCVCMCALHTKMYHIIQENDEKYILEKKTITTKKGADLERINPMN